MSIDGVLAINHRALVVSCQKKTRFGFLRLPEDLQDRIIHGMDSATMTLRQASQLAQQYGFKLSYEAISGYYKAVRRRRAELLLAQSKGEESVVQYRNVG
ncbi:MAG: hypothetical protein ABSC04_01625 [Syntrophobacteraceae bacterium]|jgi:hypothetical protein